jgi:hypothetical protein
MDELGARKFDFYYWITQSSTIRGIIALASVLGYGTAKWANYDLLSTIILAAAPLVYGIYNLIRKDSTDQRKE